MECFDEVTKKAQQMVTFRYVHDKLLMKIVSRVKVPFCANSQYFFKLSFNMQKGEEMWEKIKEFVADHLTDIIIIGIGLFFHHRLLVEIPQTEPPTTITMPLNQCGTS